MLGRGPGIFLVVQLAVAGRPVPIGSSQVGARVCLACAPAHGRKAETRGRHETLLRSGDSNIDAPRIHLERHAAERGNSINHEQSIMLRSLDRRPIVAMSLAAPDAVSIWTAKIALILPALSLRSRASTSAGHTARHQSPLSTSTSTPSLAAASPQAMANSPLSKTKILSPFNRTLVSAASHAPCPLAM